MSKINWIYVYHIVIVYYITIFVIAINGKSILFGKSIMQLNGEAKIPVFVPISWLIHDIHSAKMIGQKSDVNELMTSDMTPDMNGNFDRQPTQHSKLESESKHVITNRVSDTQTVKELPKTQNVIPKEVYPNKKPPKMQVFKHKKEDPAHDIHEMRLKLESNQQKFIAKQRFNEEIMYEPDVWPKEVDPLFTTIEIYEVPEAGPYMGLASNRTTVHKSPEDNKDGKKDDKLKIRLKSSKLKQLRVNTPKISESKLKEPNLKKSGVYSKILDSKFTESKVVESKVKLPKHSNNNKNNNYFKNYLKSNKNKFNV